MRKKQWHEVIHFASRFAPRFASRQLSRAPLLLLGVAGLFMTSARWVAATDPSPRQPTPDLFIVGAYPSLDYFEENARIASKDFLSSHPSSRVYAGVGPHPVDLPNDGRHIIIPALRFAAPGWAGIHDVTSIKDNQDMNALLTSRLSCRSSPGKGILLYITDHGESATDLNDPLTASVSIINRGNSKNPTLATVYDLKDLTPELENMLEKNAPKADQYSYQQLKQRLMRDGAQCGYIRILGTQCFSGSMHQMVFDPKLKNVCTASITDWLQPMYSDYDKGGSDPYTHGFFSEIRNPRFGGASRKASLLQAHIAGEMLDFENFGLGQVSSLAYVDYVLKEGSYDPRDSRLDHLKSKIEEEREQNELRGGKSVKSLGESPASPGRNRDGTCVIVPPTNSSVFGLLGDLVAVIDKLTEVGPLSESEISALPPALGSQYRAILANEQVQSAIRRGPNLKLQELWAEYNKLSEIHLDASSSSQAAWAKKIHDLRERIVKLVPETATLYAFNRFNQSMRRVIKFSTNPDVTPEQREKFMDLLRCESAPI